MSGRLRTFADDVLRVAGLWGLLSLVGITTMLTTLRHYWPQYAGGTLFALGIFASLLVMLVAFRVLTYLNSRNAPLNLDDLEATLRGWADRFGWFSKPLAKTDATHFVFEIRVGTMPITIFRPTILGRSVTVQLRLVFSKEQKAVFAAMSEDRSKSFLSELRLELARAKTGFKFQPPLPALEAIHISKQLPLTDDLTELDFLNVVNEINMTKIVASEIVVRSLGEGATP